MKRKHTPRKRFDLVRRAYDNKIVKWELKRLSELGILPAPINVNRPAFDHEVWVITGVFNHRHEAFV